MATPNETSNRQGEIASVAQFRAMLASVPGAPPELLDELNARLAEMEAQLYQT